VVRPAIIEKRGSKKGLSINRIPLLSPKVSLCGKGIQMLICKKKESASNLFYSKRLRQVCKSMMAFLYMISITIMACLEELGKSCSIREYVQNPDDL